jgi:hypothetical protein
MKDELSPEIEQRITDATERFGQALRELVRWSYQEDQAPSAAQIEERIREWIRRIGEDTQSWVMGNMDQYRPKGKQPCPRCGTLVYWHRYEPRRYLTSLGSLRLERAYYYHGACHCGWVPMDERLGLGACEMSPFVQEMASYLGAFMPFEQVVNYLQRYLEIEISHDTANEVTTRIGQVLREKQEASVSLAWDEGHIPESQVDEAPQEIYVSADGINHLLPNGQGKEIKVAAVYETEKRAQQRGAEGDEAIRACHIEYFVAEDAEALARTAYVAAAKRGATRAEKRIVLGDGAHWIWNRVASTMRVPDCIEVLDFHHATTYLWPAGEAAFEDDAKQANEWAAQACHDLKHKGPAPILEQLRALPVSKDAPPEDISKALTYFDHHADRMDYPDFRRQGLQIGSGTAESGVLRVVGSRINQPGMRWDAGRAQCVAHVRAAILSGRWNQFWASYRQPPRQYRRRSPPPPG